MNADKTPHTDVHPAEAQRYSSKDDTEGGDLSDLTARQQQPDQSSWSAAVSQTTAMRSQQQPADDCSSSAAMMDAAAGGSQQPADSCSAGMQLFPLRASLLEEVLNEKKLSLMRSPEVIQFLQQQQSQLHQDAQTEPAQPADHAGARQDTPHQVSWQSSAFHQVAPR